jgi:hypothetical protein
VDSVAPGTPLRLRKRTRVGLVLGVAIVLDGRLTATIR